MADRHNTNSRITSVNREAANVWNTRLTGGDAIHFLTDTEAAPIGSRVNVVVAIFLTRYAPSIP